MVQIVNITEKKQQHTTKMTNVLREIRTEFKERHKAVYERNGLWTRKDKLQSLLATQSDACIQKIWGQFQDIVFAECQGLTKDLAKIIMNYCYDPLAPKVLRETTSALVDGLGTVYFKSKGVAYVWMNQMYESVRQDNLLFVSLREWNNADNAEPNSTVAVATYEVDLENRHVQWDGNKIDLENINDLSFDLLPYEDLPVIVFALLVHL